MAGKKSGRWLWLAILLAIAGGGYAAYRATLAPKEEKITFTSAEVTRADIASWVTATGTLSPRVTVEVGSQISGRIQALHADYNSSVKKGQLVAEIDPLLFQSEVASAKASVMSAEATIKGTSAQLANAKLAYTRSRALAEKKLVAQSEADSAKSQMELLSAQLQTNKAQLAQAKANLTLKQTNLNYTKIYSPIDGVVISRDVDVGQTVAASMQAPTLFSIAEDLRKMEINTSVAESDVGLVKSDMEVEFSVDAYPSQTFSGTVKEVRYSPTTEQNVVTYNAVVSVENPDLKLLPGMTAEVRFKTAEEKNALLVPNTAIRFKPDDTFLAAAREMRDAEMKRQGMAPRRAGPPPGPPPPEMGSNPSSGAPGQEMSADAAEHSEKPRKKMNFVWILDGAGNPKPIPIQLGITDGKKTSVTQIAPPRNPPPGAPPMPELKAGDKVITSYAGGGSKAESSRKNMPMRRGGFLGGPPPPPRR